MKITRKFYYVINFILLFAVLVTSFIVATVIMYQDQKNTAASKTEILTEQVSDELNETLKRADMLSRTVFLNADFQDLTDNVYTDGNVVEEIYNHFSLLISMDDFFKNAIYIPRNASGEVDTENAVYLGYGLGYEYVQFNLPKIAALAEKPENEKGNAFFTKLYYLDGESVAYYAIVRNIYDIREDSYLQKMGVGVLFVDGGKLLDTLNGYARPLDGLDFCILEGEDIVLSSAGFQKGALVGEKYSRIEIELKDFSWKLTGVYDKSQIWNEMKENFVILVIVMTTAGASCILLATIVKRKSSESLDYLFKAFSDLEGSNIVESIPDTDDLEVNQVIDSFNRLINSVKNLNDEMLKQKNRELKLELRNTEYMLNSLHSQINKHFLINILSLLRSFINCGEAEKARDCIEDLSVFLRSSLTGGDKTTVGEELTLARSYLNIQVNRYPRISTQIVCSEEVLTTEIPKMILQPVIENAFVHGLQKKVGQIRVECREKGEFICFYVMDDGQGIDADKKREINRSLKERRKISFAVGNGIALSNIEQRLRLLAGEKSVIRVMSRKGKGTIVVLKIYKGGK